MYFEEEFERWDSQAEKNAQLLHNRPAHEFNPALNNMVRDSVIRVEVEGYIMGKNGQNIQNLGNAGFIEYKFLSQSASRSCSQ